MSPLFALSTCKWRKLDQKPKKLSLLMAPWNSFTATFIELWPSWKAATLPMLRQETWPILLRCDVFSFLWRRCPCQIGAARDESWQCWLQDGRLQKLGLDRGTIPTLLKDLNVFQLFLGTCKSFQDFPQFLERHRVGALSSAHRECDFIFALSWFESAFSQSPEWIQNILKLRTFELPGRFHQTRLWIFEVPKFEANQYLATGRWVGGWPENADLYMYTYLPTYLPAYIHPSNIQSDA